MEQFGATYLAELTATLTARERETHDVDGNVPLGPVRNAAGEGGAAQEIDPLVAGLMAESGRAGVEEVRDREDINAFESSVAAVLDGRIKGGHPNAPHVVADAEVETVAAPALDQDEIQEIELIALN
jgi:hypothetical protein